MYFLPKSSIMTFFKQITIVRILLVATTLLSQLSAMSQHKGPIVKKTKHTTVKPSVSTLGFTIIPSASNTFGYDILDNKKKIIHQPSVPGVPGNKGFAKKTDAEKVAKLVMNKIRDNQMPPTVSKHELDSLKIKL